MIVSPTDAQLYAKLGAFVTAVVPVGTTVIRGLPNRAAMPAGSFVCMQAINRVRLATNKTIYTDPFPTPGDGSNARTAPTRVDVQLDCYGAAAGDLAQMLSTMFRDEYGCTALAPECQPLFADEPKMVPMVTGEEQYLQRWTVTASLQYNPVTSTPQEFAGELSATIINVDVEFPP